MARDRRNATKCCTFTRVNYARFKDLYFHFYAYYNILNYFKSTNLTKYESNKASDIKKWLRHKIYFVAGHVRPYIHADYLSRYISWNHADSFSSFSSRTRHLPTLTLSQRFSRKKCSVWNGGGRIAHAAFKASLKQHARARTHALNYVCILSWSLHLSKLQPALATKLSSTRSQTWRLLSCCKQVKVLNAAGRAA